MNNFYLEINNIATCERYFRIRSNSYTNSSLLKYSQYYLCFILSFGMSYNKISCRTFSYEFFLSNSQVPNQIC